MSGHNKWSKIKHKKAAKDAKRGNLFTKLAKAITLAASEGGGDIDMNFALRLAVDKAKEANMPNDNIDRAIKKGTGEIEGGQIVRISYEAYGPASSAIIIDCATDNTNRTLAEVRKLVESSGGKIAESGSVAWQFEEKGYLQIRPAKLKKSEKYGADDIYEDVDIDELTLEIMEISGVEDISQGEYENEEGENFKILEVITDRNKFADVDGKIRDLGVKVLNSELAKLAKDSLDVSVDDAGRIQKLVGAVEEHDDVDSVWVNS